jgi:uncharacterized cupin superfamily protein
MNDTRSTDGDRGAAPIPETSLSRSDAGVAPAGPGWFVVNVAEAAGMRSDSMGEAAIFHGAQRFEEFGINVRILAPGQIAAKYHAENAQEAFLVLHGTCLLVVNDEERELAKGDFFFSPPGLPHVIVGAGSEPCTVLAVGTLKADQGLHFPLSPTAARHGAAVAEPTSDAAVAYADVGETSRGPLARIPW